MNEMDAHAGAATADQELPDIGVAQILALAQAANVHLDMVDGRLVLRSSEIDSELWPAVRQVLSEIGVDALARYFRSTTSEERMRLAAIPAHPGPRAIGCRFPLQ